jgi:hypothetical protein
MDSLASAAFEAFRAALAKNQGRRPLLLQVFWADGTIDTYGLNGIVPGNTPPLKAERATRELSERETAVMDVLGKASKPLKGQAIALRAGIRYNGRFRSMMAKMVED